MSYISTLLRHLADLIIQIFSTNSHSFGFHRSAIYFLNHIYITVSKQFVSYNSYNSSYFTASSGDLEIFSTINTIGECDFMQCQLVKQQSWCRNNKLFLNTSKCKGMSLCKENICFEM